MFLESFYSELEKIAAYRKTHGVMLDMDIPILELPKGTVKSRLHRARHELARKLGRRITIADVI